MKSYKSLFSRSLAHIPAHLHAAAHSHHLRPDITLQAQIDCANDAFRLADNKWGHFFSTIYTAAQNHVAHLLNTGQPDNVVFATNTHEFIVRLLSCLPPGRPARILTTDSEFHSAARQFQRQEEAGLATITRIPTAPFETFPERFMAAIKAGPAFDVVFFSHVFFNSGFVVPDLNAIVRTVDDNQTMIVIDGYHGFMAIPTDLAEIKDRAFYMSGGYKYVMSGEGSCFMHVPPGYGLRPVNTGWFGGFERLDQPQGKNIFYSEGAARFAGATFDPSGLYRFVAVLDLLAEQNITVDDIHQRVASLQSAFLNEIKKHGITQLPETALEIGEATKERGHFLTFRTDDAGAISKILMDGGLFTDHRGDRLRFGFGLYHDADDMAQMAAIAAHLLSH